jgi:2-C-methyl-D-erythritol 4-phosphate cytidylyltransferase
MKKIAIIVAAGKGLRLGETLPKQFLLLSGKPVLHWTIQRFYDNGADVYVMLHPDMVDYWNDLARQHHTPNHHCLIGGDERFHSVKNAIEQLPVGEAVVAIHDAARPNVSASLIASLFQTAEKRKSAVPFVIPSDSVRIKTDDGVKMLDRNEVLMIQTPQCFFLADLKLAYQKGYKPSFTDDASVMEEHLSVPLCFVEGEKLNFKITHPADWEIMQQIFKP